MDSGGHIDCIYMDFEKAIDKVPHRRLISKLHSYGIHSKIIRWITDFLEKSNLELLSMANFLHGIRQGSILGPLLFIIYIFEFCKDLQMKLYLYADDTKVYRHIYNSEDQDKLQNDINRVNDWADEWLLKLHIAKCYNVSYTANMGSFLNTNYYMSNGNVNYELKKWILLVIWE